MCFVVNFAKFLRTLSYRAAPVVASENGVITIWLTTLRTAVKFFVFFFYQGFLSRTLTTHRTAGEGRGRLFELCM